MIEVKMPKGAKELRIKHFKSMSLIPVDGFKQDSDHILFLAEFLGLGYNQMLDFVPSDIGRMSALAVDNISRMDLTSKLPEKIKLDGQTFCLVNPETIGIGWHIDFKSCDINKDPVRLACMFYVQEGFNYSDVDENSNITFPIASRYEVFKEHFPLELFLRSADFFLRRSLESKKKSMVKEVASKSKGRRISSGLEILNLSSGKLRLKK
jgi:hypothetical protein